MHDSEWLVVVASLCILLVGLVVPVLVLALRSYGQKKGENLATKEDIGEITRIVEEARTEFAQQFELLAHANRMTLEREKQRHDMRLVATDRRLAAHQEAYTHWWMLLGAMFRPEPETFISECEVWFVRNRLYLEPEVADAFSRGYHAAREHAVLRANGDPSIGKNWETIRVVGETIVKACALPPLRDGETKDFTDDGRPRK